MSMDFSLSCTFTYSISGDQTIVLELDIYKFAIYLTIKEIVFAIYLQLFFLLSPRFDTTMLIFVLSIMPGVCLHYS